MCCVSFVLQNYNIFLYVVFKIVFLVFKNVQKSIWTKLKLFGILFQCYSRFNV